MNSCKYIDMRKKEPSMKYVLLSISGLILLKRLQKNLKQLDIKASGQSINPCISITLFPLIKNPFKPTDIQDLVLVGNAHRFTVTRVKQPQRAARDKIGLFGSALSGLQWKAEPCWFQWEKVQMLIVRGVDLG